MKDGIDYMEAEMVAAFHKSPFYGADVFYAGWRAALDAAHARGGAKGGEEDDDDPVMPPPQRVAGPGVPVGERREAKPFTLDLDDDAGAKETP